MSILKILEYPDPKLRKKAQPVTEFNDDLSSLINDMYETMYHDNGIGLAATQVNIQQRVLVLDLQEQGEKQPMCLINPEILEKEGAIHSPEGCLSVPGAYEDVMRAEKIRYRAQDQEGNESTQEATGMLAICIQHEIDHLNGILFIDHLSGIRRERVRKKLMQLKKQKRKGS